MLPWFVHWAQTLPNQGILDKAAEALMRATK